MEICECQPDEPSMSDGGGVSFHGGVASSGMGQWGWSCSSMTSSGVVLSSAGSSGGRNVLAVVRTGDGTTGDGDSVVVSFGITT